MRTFHIGKMSVSIESNTVITFHPDNAMKCGITTFEVRKHIVTGDQLVVLNDRSFNKHQSKSAVIRIKNDILKYL